MTGTCPAPQDSGGKADGPSAPLSLSLEALKLTVVILSIGTYPIKVFETRSECKGGSDVSLHTEGSIGQITAAGDPVCRRTPTQQMLEGRPGMGGAGASSAGEELTGHGVPQRLKVNREPGFHYMNSLLLITGFLSSKNKV